MPGQLTRKLTRVKIIVAAATLSILPSTLAAPATINPANELKRQSLNVRLVCNNATWRYTHGNFGCHYDGKPWGGWPYTCQLQCDCLPVHVCCGYKSPGADGEEESAEIRKVGESFCSGESRLIPSYRICAKRRTCTFNQSDQLRRM